MKLRATNSKNKNLVQNLIKKILFEWLELRKESEKKKNRKLEKKINKEINAMNKKKIEEYSKFKGELNQQLSTFTAIDFNKMRERENNKTDKPEEQQENNKTDKPEEQQEKTIEQTRQKNKKEKNKTDRPEEKTRTTRKRIKQMNQKRNMKIYIQIQKDSIKAIYIEAATGKSIH